MKLYLTNVIYHNNPNNNANVVGLECVAVYFNYEIITQVCLFPNLHLLLQQHSAQQLYVGPEFFFCLLCVCTSRNRGSNKFLKYLKKSDYLLSLCVVFFFSLIKQAVPVPVLFIQAQRNRIKYLRVCLFLPQLLRVYSHVLSIILYGSPQLQSV